MTDFKEHPEQGRFFGAQPAGCNPLPNSAAEDAAALHAQVRQAFDELHAPADLCRATLDAIERRRGEGLPSAEADVRQTREEGEPEAAFCAIPGGARPASRRRQAKKALRRMLAAAACVLAVSLGVAGIYLYGESGSSQTPIEAQQAYQPRSSADTAGAPGEASQAPSDEVTQPQAYIGIDVNPSMELSVDAAGTVLDATALNEDGAAALAGVELAGKPYAQALAELLGAPSMKGCLEGNPYVEVSVTSSDDALAAQLQRQSDDCLAELGCDGICNRVSEQTREEAHHAGMGVGRYCAAQTLMELDPSVTLDDCSHMPMREIRDRIEGCEDGGKDGRGAETRGQGRHGEEFSLHNM